MRRFTRLTNALSKKIDRHIHALSLYHVFYNSTRTHNAHRMSPAMAAGVTDRLWSMEDVVALIDARAPRPGSAGLTGCGLRIPPVDLRRLWATSRPHPRKGHARNTGNTLGGTRRSSVSTCPRAGASGRYPAACRVWGSVANNFQTETRPIAAEGGLALLNTLRMQTAREPGLVPTR
jgi:hypothetical protein